MLTFILVINWHKFFCNRANHFSLEDNHRFFITIGHYMALEGREDVEKFVIILNNRHSDEGPFVKPLALKPGEIFEYVV